ncbi:hypothetical protein CBL_21473, partial [Carabus blaptoides fortunei]
LLWSLRYVEALLGASLNRPGDWRITNRDRGRGHNEQAERQERHEQISNHTKRYQTRASSPHQDAPSVKGGGGAPRRIHGSLGRAAPHCRRRRSQHVLDIKGWNTH